MTHTRRSNRLLFLSLAAVTFFIGVIITFIVTEKRAPTTDVLKRVRVEAAIERIQIRGIGTVDYQHLFTAISEPGESMDHFAFRLAPRLREFSDATGFEACGVIATDGERFGAVIGSNHAHIACANFSSKVPAGMEPTTQTIHSHGTDQQFSANRNDKALQGEQLAGARGGIRGVAGQRLDAFSAMDYHGGPGYLATPNGVIHQRGRGTSREVPSPKG